MEIQYSQLKINHLNDTPTKAAGGDIFSGVFQQGRQGTSQGQEDFELSWYLFFEQELHSTQDATKRVMQILDAKYKKAHLQSIIRDNCKHLHANQQKKLLQLLKKYEMLFDGTLGDWKTKPVSFQLRKGVSPDHG
jgi:hypothetical protein